MKYVNSLKYIDGFKLSSEDDEISSRRISELCLALGQINRGVRFIHVPEGAAGHGCAILLESIIKAAGYKIGRIVSAEDADSRASVFVGGEIPSIEDYNKCVAEVKAKVGKLYNVEYLKEEIVFALSLLLCRLEGCEFIILEGTDRLDRVCAPFELTVIPTVYDTEKGMEKVARLCDSIRCGTREVVSGNQKSEIYNYISQVCAPSGQRLFIPVKAQFCVVEQSSRRLVFNYNGRDGFVIKTPSLIMRDCAMTVIEAIMAIRREGIRIPVSAIFSGIEAAGGTGSFEVISYTPTIIADNSYETDEVCLMYKTFCEIFGDKKFSVCIPAESQAEAEKLLSSIPTERLCSVIICGHDYDITECYSKPVTVCRTHKDAAKIIAADKDVESVWICYGGSFSQKIKSEIIKLANR